MAAAGVFFRLASGSMSDDRIYAQYRTKSV